MYDGGSKDWKDGWSTEKYEKYEKSQERRSEHCILSSVAFMLARVRRTLTLAQRIGGATLKPIQVADCS